MIVAVIFAEFRRRLVLEFIEIAVEHAQGIISADGRDLGNGLVGGYEQARSVTDATFVEQCGKSRFEDTVEQSREIAVSISHDLCDVVHGNVFRIMVFDIPEHFVNEAAVRAVFLLYEFCGSVEYGKNAVQRAFEREHIDGFEQLIYRFFRVAEAEYRIDCGKIFRFIVKIGNVIGGEHAEIRPRKVTRAVRMSFVGKYNGTFALAERVFLVFHRYGHYSVEHRDEFETVVHMHGEVKIVVALMIDIMILIRSFFFVNYHVRPL